MVGSSHSVSESVSQGGAATVTWQQVPKENKAGRLRQNWLEAESQARGEGSCWHFTLA